MGRIIINNESGMSDYDVTEYVATVINQGRISDNGKAYCYATTFPLSGIVVYATRRKASDSFLIREEATQ